MDERAENYHVLVVPCPRCDLGDIWARVGEPVPPQMCDECAAAAVDHDAP